ncbi:MAG TPA: ABC-type transport auxiliary lipoprotein family protein [Steroidobacteraceae bacterium]|nr:ABC-type transport auxiliary lipoprotein family protein [Steroidobacteraceae bacterium]
MRTAVALLGMSAALLVSGCFAGLHSNQPPQQQYLLSVPARPAGAAPAGAGAAGARAATGTALEVLAPVAAPGLGGDGIAVIRSGQRLDDYAGVRWAAAAPAMLQTLAIEALRRQGRFSLVESDTGPFAAGYVLSLEVTHFEADYTGAGSGGEPGDGDGAAAPMVHVTLVCTLGRRAGRSIVTTLTVDSRVQAGADRLRDVIGAFQRATDQALLRMAGEIVPVMPGR